MNLFLLSQSVRLAAWMHCNRHVVKMILETTQLLYTAAHMGGVQKFTLKPYRKTHAWHPTAIWVRETRENWRFAIRFGLALCRQYTMLYKKKHKCEEHLRCLLKLGYHAPLETRPIKNKRGAMRNGCTPFPLAMPEECVCYTNGKPDAVLSYRKYYEVKNKEWTKKGRPMKWCTKHYGRV